MKEKYKIFICLLSFFALMLVQPVYAQGDLAIEDLLNQAINLIGGSLVWGSIIVIAVALLATWLGVRLIKGILVQVFLFVIAWFPSIVVYLAVDFTSVDTPIALSGSALLCFPYIWDVLIGMAMQEGVSPYYISLGLGGLFVSFIALWHVSYLMCKKMENEISHPLLMSPFFGFLGLNALGFFLPNFWAYVATYWLLPMVTIVVSVIAIVVLFYYRKVKGEGESLVFQ